MTVLDSHHSTSVAPVAIPDFFNMQKKLFKAKVLDVYYDKLYMEYYNFYKQCKDHFATTAATSHNKILFVASLLKNLVLNH